MKHREIKDRSMSTWVEKEMATHSSILAWEISWTEELGRVTEFMGLQRIRHNLASEHTCMHAVSMHSTKITGN